MAPRGPTAYFLFSEEQRAVAKAELQAQPGAKAGVAQVAQLIGRKWAALSDEEKQAYKERAQQLKEEAAAVAAAAASAEEQGRGAKGGEVCPTAGPGEEGQEQQAGAVVGGGAAPPFGFPTGLTKRIIMVDDEVSRVSADAVRAIAKATELFVQQLATKALQHAQSNKRKNFKAPDVAHVAGRDRRLLDMGLREVLEQRGDTSGGSNDNEGENKHSKQQSSKRQKQQEAAAVGTRQITSFFGAAAT